MRTVLLAFAATFAYAAAAAAQPAVSTPAAPAVEETGYIEGVAQSAFGHVTSQSYGIEAGYLVRPQAEAFFEFGHVADVSTQSIQDSAQTVATSLASSGVSVTVREPVTFLTVGGKYVVATGGKVHPYLLAGAGVARVKRDVVFRAAGMDVTGNIDQFGVTLGADLAGTSTNLTLMGGGGAMIPVGRIFMLDLQVRFNRVMSDPGISIGRAGVGFGIRF